MTEDDVDTPFEAFWGDLLDDVEATAVEYREEGWETHALTVGDVTALYATDKPYGLDVLVPESAFELVAGPFKGEKAKVQRIDEGKDQVTVELYEATVPIPVTVRGDQIRVLDSDER